jgi:hypothetical protein
VPIDGREADEATARAGQPVELGFCPGDLICQPFAGLLPPGKPGRNAGAKSVVSDLRAVLSEVGDQRGRAGLKFGDRGEIPGLQAGIFLPGQIFQSGQQPGTRL